MYQTIRGWITRNGLTNRDEILAREGWWLDQSGPMLSDEIDLQAWVADRAITKPQGEMRGPATGPCWKPADYAEMAAERVAPQISEGGKAISEVKAAKWLREAMAFSSEPVSYTLAPSPWDLRGDRVVVPVEPDPDPTDGVAVDAAVARELGTVPALLTMSDANLAAARSLMSESDAQFARMLGTEDGSAGPVGEGVSDDHLGASDSTAGNSRNAVQAGTPSLLSPPSRPSGVTDVDGDEDEEERPAKPLVYKKPEPPARFHKDEWGFPIPPPADDDLATGSEPPQPEEGPASEEPAASPPSDQLGTDGSAGAASQDAGSSHYQSIEPALRAATIQERGMRTRIQVTGYRDGKYVRGEADNFVVPDAMASAVREALEPIAEGARARHGAAVAAGKAPRKGGPRVRIQLTEYATDGGEYLRQDGTAGAAQNLNAPGMAVAEVAALIDHQLATHFGVRRGDAAALVRAWRAFSGEPSAPALEPEAVAAPVGKPALVGKRYDKRLHLGFFAVVSGREMRVESLWESERQALQAARRTGARVVDAEGYLVPQAEVNAAPEAAPDPEVWA